MSAKSSNKATKAFSKASPRTSSKAAKSPKTRRWSIKRIFLILMLLGLGYLGIEFLLLPSGREYQATNPATTALIEAREAQAKSNGQPLDRKQTWVSINKISPNLVRAVLAGEDAKFFKHNGFDTDAMQKALEKDIEERRFARGASTISQQLAKNLYLSESKNPLRKFKEALITKRMENNLSKKRILEIYLNVIEWGDGIFGAEAAAHKYFGKSAAQLSTSEGAYLAAMIPNPRTVYNPAQNPKKVARRQQILLRHMKGVSLPKDW